MIFKETAHNKILREIVSVVNESLEQTWTDYEFANGKEVDICPSWRGDKNIKKVINRYRKVGWSVVRKVEIVSTDTPGCYRDYLTFAYSL
jgi:hypothetical protein